MKPTTRSEILKQIWKILFVIIGAALGFAYYQFIGCRSGTCPLTSNPWISTGYGALLGLVLSFSSRKTQKNSSDEESN
ncbi:MAG TPA: hypothetical protein ENN22_06880 [bacterium]|nr:hypothetical protein [bacterium]